MDLNAVFWAEVQVNSSLMCVRVQFEFAVFCMHMCIGVQVRTRVPMWAFLCLHIKLWRFFFLKVSATGDLCQLGEFGQFEKNSSYLQPGHIGFQKAPW